MDQTRHAAAGKTAWRLMFGLAFRIPHKTAVKWLFGADEVVIIKGQLAALTAL
jgi:hypothetical protein